MELLKVKKSQPSVTVFANSFANTVAVHKLNYFVY